MTLLSSLPPGLVHKLAHFSSLVSQGDYGSAVTMLGECKRLFEANQPGCRNEFLVLFEKLELMVLGVLQREKLLGETVERLDASHTELKALEQRLKRENTVLKQQLRRRFSVGKVIGSSPKMANILRLAQRVAETTVNVLITGETGTGKELFARAIHQNSDRKDCPFVVVDCAALPEHLVESMLFGHEKGAFTTADKRHVGLIRQAHGGVLFLDEVGELPLEVQKAFLRVLQERRFRPVGGTREEESDFRVVAATNRDLDEMVAAWRFRQDLLFRLRTITIDLPPLRERTGDIEALARHFLETLTRETDGGPKRTSPEFWGALLEYTWPGNVRELGNALESALAAAGNDPVLLPRHLPINIRAMLARMSVNGGPCQADLEPMEERIVFSHDNFPTIKDFRTDALARVEHRYLAELLRVSEGKIQRACALSGLSRARLYALMKQYSIER